MSDKADCPWKPVLLLDTELKAAHGDIVQIAGEKNIEVIDQLCHQQEELNELIHDCADELKTEKPMWVYYPWRRTVVRVLGRKAYSRLRSDRNRNKITAAEQQVLFNKTIAVIGLSVGHSVAYALAQEGLCGRLILVDHDELSLSNLNRIPGDLSDITLPKTVALARRIAELDPYITLEIEQKGLTAENVDALVETADLIVDECDSIDIKFELRFAARRSRVPVIMQTSDGGVLDVERFDLEPDRAVFHGLTPVTDSAALSGLSNAEKVPHVMAILEADKISARLAASLIEIDEQVSTWPQLASDVSFGAGMAGAAVRRWGLGQRLPSGRLRLDMDVLLSDLSTPTIADVASVKNSVVPSPRTFSDRVLLAASRAPSGGNAQPWHFYADENSMEIFLDPSRSTAMDVSFRGSLLALGAATFNAQVVASAEQKVAELSLCGERMTVAQRNGTEAVAKLRFNARTCEELSLLATMVDKRACARRQGKSAPINSAWVANTKKHAKQAGVEAIFLRGSTLAAAADIWAEADRIRFLTPNLHREMFEELNFPGDSMSTGIDVATLELSNKDAAALNVVKRSDTMRELASWGGGKKLGDASRKAMLDADAFLVLTVSSNRDCDYITGGCTLQRIWLEATRDGVGLHPLSPLFLYATSPSDLVGRVAPANAKKMWDLRVAFAQLCGFKSEQPIALTLRATSLVEASVASQRETIKARTRLRDKNKKVAIS